MSGGTATLLNSSTTNYWRSEMSDCERTAMYAKSTTVSVERSRTEIERNLMKYNADGFAYGTSGRQAMIEFMMSERRVRFVLNLPDRNDKALRFSHHRPPRKRTLNQINEAFQQEERRLWRALALCILAKLESIESGITTFDDEFMAHMVMPDGRLFGEHALPAIEATYAGGNVKPLLALPGAIERGGE